MAWGTWYGASEDEVSGDVESEGEGSADAASADRAGTERAERARGRGRDSRCGSRKAGAADSVLSVPVEGAAGSCSASKYAGCKGGGAGWSAGSAGFFLR